MYWASSLEGPPCSFHHLLHSDQPLDLLYNLGRKPHEDVSSVNISCIVQSYEVMCLVAQNKGIWSIEINTIKN